MGIFRFKSKGPAYGLGYTTGQLIEIDETKGLTAKAFVNEVYGDGQNAGQPTGKMVMADKQYTVDFLLENDVIAPATAEERASFQAGTDINSITDEKNAEDAAAEIERNKIVAEQIASKK